MKRKSRWSKVTSKNNSFLLLLLKKIGVRRARLLRKGREKTVALQEIQLVTSLVWVLWTSVIGQFRPQVKTVACHNGGRRQRTSSAMWEILLLSEITCFSMRVCRNIRSCNTFVSAHNKLYINVFTNFFATLINVHYVVELTSYSFILFERLTWWVAYCNV